MWPATSIRDSESEHIHYADTARTVTPMKINCTSLISAVILILACTARAQGPAAAKCEVTEGFDFQIATDKLVYAPKSMVHVKFLITNTDYTERRDASTGQYNAQVLYLVRALGDCTSPMGFFWLTVLDKNNKRVPVQGCSADVLMDKVDAVELFANPETGIALRPGQVYGSEAEFQLPPKHGTYRLKAELFTGDFNPKQQRALAERQMTVLPPRCDISAPVITITVK
jgi:hypothetical protein